ncbi:olfactory receptor 1C1-like [Engystomops pustulosus]|uniref:olfactory receptor 1C1-like n=1 Tax=Engystomops pustulosus TaxID=76066 RepID=UPI003AFB2D5A
MGDAKIGPCRRKQKEKRKGNGRNGWNLTERSSTSQRRDKQKERKKKLVSRASCSGTYVRYSLNSFQQYQLGNSAWRSRLLVYLNNQKKKKQGYSSIDTGLLAFGHVNVAHTESKLGYLPKAHSPRPWFLPTIGFFILQGNVRVSITQLYIVLGFSPNILPMIQMFSRLFSAMKNLTTVSEFILIGLSDHPHNLPLLFLVFFFIYVLTVIVNFLIIVFIFIDSQLHTPMYFFLGNLAFIDVSYSSVTAPRMLIDLVTKNHSISIPSCITQVFFFIYLASAELFLLSAMSYDRYIAICHPLHYTQIMSWTVCTQMASGVWILGFLYSLVHTLFSLRLTFCGPNTIHNFFCDLPHLFQISCTDTFINIIVILIVGGILGIGAFAITLVPYIRIFTTILKIRTHHGKLKAFSTCTSHLTVVFIFYASIIFIYFVPTTSNLFTVNRVVSVTYALINPLLNPLIYSIRNKDLKAAVRILAASSVTPEEDILKLKPIPGHFKQAHHSDPVGFKIFLFNYAHADVTTTGF